MKKIARMGQPNGLGDILFLQKYAQVLLDLNYIVYWDVIPEYKNISKYIIKKDLHFKYPKIEPDIIINFNDYAEVNHPHDIMTSKYKNANTHLPTMPELHNIKWEDWADYVDIERLLDKEDILYYNILGLRDGEEYIFVNKNWARGKKWASVGSEIQNKTLRIIEMDILPIFTLFDWGKVLENASEIHTVDTSINYYIEKLNLKTNIMYCHPRHPKHTQLCLEKLFNKPWRWL